MQVAYLQSNAKSKVKENEQLQTQLKLMTDMNRNLENNVNEYKNMIHNLKQTITILNQDGNVKEEIKQLKKQLNDKNDVIKDKLFEINQLNILINQNQQKYQNELDSIKDELNNTLVYVDNIKQDNDNKTQTINTCNQEIKNLYQIISDKDNVITQLNQNYTLLNNTLLSMKDKQLKLINEMQSSQEGLLAKENGDVDEEEHMNVDKSLKDMKQCLNEIDQLIVESNHVGGDTFYMNNNNNIGGNNNNPISSSSVNNYDDLLSKITELEKENVMLRNQIVSNHHNDVNSEIDLKDSLINDKEELNQQQQQQQQQDYQYQHQQQISKLIEENEKLLNENQMLKNECNIVNMKFNQMLNEKENNDYIDNINNNNNNNSVIINNDIDNDILLNNNNNTNNNNNSIPITNNNNDLPHRHISSLCRCTSPSPLLSSIFLFRISDNTHITRFDLSNREFQIIEFTDLCEFSTHYIKEGSIYLNLFDSFFILTGQNHDTLFYFNNAKSTMTQITKFTFNHSHGALLLDLPKKQIFAISGSTNPKVEHYTNEELFSIENNSTSLSFPINNNGELSLLADMTKERGDASYLYMDEVIYAFFGYCYPTKSYIDTIEFYDTSISNTEHVWNVIQYNTDTGLTFMLKQSGIVPVNENAIFLLGGYDGINNAPVQRLVVFDFEKCTIKEENKDLPDIKCNQFYSFGNESQFVSFSDDQGQMYMTNVDEEGNVHIIELGSLRYDLYKLN